MAAKVIVIHPGETVVLPVGVVIDSLILDGSISVTSTCDNLPPPEAQQCYKMEWSASDDAVSNYTLEHTQTTLKYIMIGGVQYDIELLVNDPGVETAFQNISNQIPGVFDFEDLNLVPLVNRGDYTMLFKSVPSIAADIELWIIGDGFPTNGLFIKPYTSDDCA